MERDEAGGIGTANAQRSMLRGALTATGLRDHAAFRRVYELTSAKLFGICLRICGERQAAEDVLQEVYSIIWRRAASYDATRASPITWLATIARNRAIDWRRAQRAGMSEPLPDYAADPAIEPVDSQFVADDELIRQEDVRRLRDCLAALNERPRRVIRTAFLDGLTYSELATRENVPLSTVKSTVRRGLLQLRKCLNDDA